MKKITLLLAIIFSSTQLIGQKSNSPYELDWLRDGIWTGVGLAGSAGGLVLIQNKDDMTMEEFNNLDEDDIPAIDRWAAGNNSENASKLSDIPFAASFALPFLTLLDGKINDHTGQLIILYLEAFSTTATMYSMTVGLVDRSRPYVYDDSGETGIGRRMSNNGQRSFYAGHVAASATGTFLAAKIYSDFNPDAKGKFWVWAGAAAIPAAVSYYRIEAGQHFLTDVSLGYVLGAATGILVPELHKKRDSKVAVYPSAGRSFMGDEYQGLSVRYTF
ncbi:MAG: phosphoesterase PA-phosphatase [Flavobacteriaceae bacterium]|nr:phosphoesterase PA-phosphatase [Flavobacteriaceae bacterium]